MRLAECEAETICNLEKENFKLSDLLSKAEQTLESEKEKYQKLEDTHRVKFAIKLGLLWFKLRNACV